MLKKKSSLILKNVESLHFFSVLTANQKFTSYAPTPTTPAIGASNTASSHPLTVVVSSISPRCTDT